MQRHYLFTQVLSVTYPMTDGLEPNFFTIHLHQRRASAYDLLVQQQPEIISPELCSIVDVISIQYSVWALHAIY